MLIHDEIRKKVPQFETICRDHQVQYIYAFGSSVTDNFDPERSDIDLLVEIDDPDPLQRGEKLISLWDTFENLFQRRVDLLTESSIKNPYLKKSINASKILIYDRSGEKTIN